MQFSMVFEAQMADASLAHERQVLRDCVDQAIYAEAMDFDRVWAVEHHCLRWYAHMSAPEVFLTWVAARTERIRVGHGVVCMPFNYNHPIRVAERAAMLPFAPGRLITTTCCPQILPSPSATKRASTSGVEPAAASEMTVTGRSG